MEQTTERLLHITIGTHPAKDLDLSQEIRLAKAALLYADRVRLYHPGSIFPGFIKFSGSISCLMARITASVPVPCSAFIYFCFPMPTPPDSVLSDR